jgi:hypothetical protein
MDLLLSDIAKVGHLFVKIGPVMNSICHFRRLLSVLILDRKHVFLYLFDPFQCQKRTLDFRSSCGTQRAARSIHRGAAFVVQKSSLQTVHYL